MKKDDIQRTLEPFGFEFRDTAWESLEFNASRMARTIDKLIVIRFYENYASFTSPPDEGIDVELTHEDAINKGIALTRLWHEEEAYEDDFDDGCAGC